MRIRSKDIRTVLQKAVEYYGSQSSLARKTGISQRNISRWLSGQVDKINGDLWNKISPHIRPFMPEGFEETYHVPSSPEIDGLALERDKIWTELDRCDRLEILKYMEQLREERVESPPAKYNNGKIK